MKKLLVCLAVVMGIMYTSCTSSEESFPNYEADKPMNEAINEHPTIVQQLTEVNDSIRETLIGPESRGWLKRLIRVCKADINGAIKGGEKGAGIGRTIGGWFGNESKGEDLGRDIGAGIVGFIASLKAYYTDESYDNGDIPGIEEAQTAYCEFRNELSDYVNDGDDDTAYIGYLNLPLGRESIEDIGKIHNKLLDRFLGYGKGEDIAPYGLIVDVPVVDDVSTLSPIEMDILESEELAECYSEVIYDINNGNFELENFEISDIVKDVMGLYNEMLDQISNQGGVSNVVNLTNQYIALIAENEEISENDKEILYVAFSVGVYSYMYWSNYEGEE